MITGKTKFLIPLLLLSLTLLFCLTTVSAASGDTIYVNIGGNDSWDGQLPIYDGTSGPKLSIKNATGTVNTNGTIYIADGTYRENNIPITKNMNIIGKSQQNTIVNGTNSGSTIFTIASGVNVTISNLTLTNGTSTKGGAIYNKGNLTVTNCTFTGNNATNFGGAIVNYGTAAGNAYAYIANCTFKDNTAKNNAGAIYNQFYSNLTVTGCIFDHNTVTSSSGTGGAISNDGLGNDLVYSVAYATITNSTFTNNRAYEGGAIFNSYDHNYLTVTNCTLQNNIASQYGGAVYNAGNCTVTLINTTFKNNAVTGSTGIGGAIYNQATYVNNGIFNVMDCTFTSNTAYDGGAIYHIIDILNVTNSTFTQNTATHTGGAIFAGGQGTLNVTNSTFTQNSASYGGAIYNTGNCTINAHFNRIVENTANKNGISIYNNWGTVNATFNWWGSNTDPTTILNLIVGSVNANPWVILTVTANPTTINNGETSTITADLNHINGGGPLTGGNIPDGIQVTFTTAWGSLTQYLTTTMNGQATTTFNADGTSNPTTNPVQIYAIVDNENSVYTPVNVIIPTTITVDPAENYAGQTVTLTAHVNAVGSPIGTGGTVSFAVDNIIVPGGSAQPVTNGVATCIWTIPSDWTAGNHNITAAFSGDANYASSTGKGVLTVDKTPTNLTVGNASDFWHQYVNIAANLTDYYGNPLNNENITFTIAGDPNTYNAVTGANGLATLHYQIIQNTGIYTINAAFSSDDNYLASLTSLNGNLTVNPTPTNITISNITGVNNQTVTLNATLTDIYGNPLTNQSVNFNINGKNIENATTDGNGAATIQYTPTSAGNYIITVNYQGNQDYVDSQGTGTLTVKPAAYLYLNYTIPNNPTAGKTFIITYKLSNKGPDNATNVTISFQIPEGLEFVGANVDSGNCTYNPANRTITWTLSNVAVGDPYLYLQVKPLKAGRFTINTILTSMTFNQNTQKIPSLIINAVNQPANNGSGSSTISSNGSSATVKAANKITMQNTGLPLNYLILAIMMFISGLIVPKRK